MVVLKKREGNFIKRLRRLGALRRKGYDVQKLFVTGFQAYAFMAPRWSAWTPDSSSRPKLGTLAW